MTEPHGTRQTYQAGCHCCPCRAANAAYIAQLRRQHATGHTPLGAHVSGVEVRRRIQQLLIERFTRAEIARRLGLKRGRLELHTDRVTLRNVLKVRRLYRLAMGGEGPNQPNV